MNHENPKEINMKPVGLGNIRILIDVAQNLPIHCIRRS
jgi:hypothetical protein